MLTQMPNVHFSSFTLALLIGWIFSVCVHEFAHALAAFFGGDRSERTQGYLRFNPLDYLDPITSLLIPSVCLLMGGVPFPGGAVMIREDLLRSRRWRSAVSAAGPLSNILLFAMLALLLHPAVGIVESHEGQYTTWQRFLGALTVLQLFAVFINLLPLPPLDGFGILEPYMRYEDRIKFRQPPYGYAGFIAVFVLLSWVEPVSDRFWKILMGLTDHIGLDWDLLYNSYNLAFFGSMS